MYVGVAQTYDVLLRFCVAFALTAMISHDRRLHLTAITHAHVNPSSITSA